MCPWLTGWLTLMLKLDGVEMIFAESRKKSERKSGICVQRNPWNLSPNPWVELDAAAQYDMRAVPHSVPLAHDPYGDTDKPWGTGVEEDDADDAS